jgi:hypothetical protein
MGCSSLKDELAATLYFPERENLYQIDLKLLETSFRNSALIIVNHKN